MYLSLQGEGSTEYARKFTEWVSKEHPQYFVVSASSFMNLAFNAYKGSINLSESSNVIEIHAQEEEFDNPHNIYFETGGGIVSRNRPKNEVDSVDEREKNPSNEVYPFNIVGDDYKYFFVAMKYAYNRSKYVSDTLNTLYLGEVYGSPRTVFVTESAGDWDELLKIIDYLPDFHRHHVGITTTSQVAECVESLFPSAAYVGVGSRAYEVVKRVIGDDAVVSGMPNLDPLRNGYGTENAYRRYARLIDNIVVVGKRATSHLSLL